ncbi:MAG: hypothetical protein GY941_08630 [Planctomycetes bacterium]|nr:hypothetical protein [Planctomycetota bacterium]
MDIIGISPYYHHSTPALVRINQLSAAAQEVWFTRKKHGAGFSHHAIRYYHHKPGVSLTEINDIIYYNKPLRTFNKQLETHLFYSYKNFKFLLTTMPVLLKEKRYLQGTPEIKAIFTTRKVLNG